MFICTTLDAVSGLKCSGLSGFPLCQNELLCLTFDWRNYTCKGLQHLPWDERLREMGLSKPEKRNFVGILLIFMNVRQGRCRENRYRLLLMVFHKKMSCFKIILKDKFALCVSCIFHIHIYVSEYCYKHCSTCLNYLNCVIDLIKKLITHKTK